MSRSVLCAVLAASWGCTSEGMVVLPPELGDFGPVRSAIWLVVEDTEDTSGDVDHRLVMSNRADLCRHTQEAYAGVAGLQEQYYADIDEFGKSSGDPGFGLGFCEILRDHLGRWADATSGLIGPDQAFVSIGTRAFVEGADYDRTPRSGTHVAVTTTTSTGGSVQTEPTWGGWLIRYGVNPHRAAADAVSCSADDPYEWYYQLKKKNSFEPGYQRFEGGTLTLDALDADTFDGVVEGASVGGLSGFEAEGIFDRCDVQSAGYVDLGLQ